jgi:microcystin-dependent protein
MSICTDCYNGCTEIHSDRCIRYTGLSIPALGILNGDSLSCVEQAITTYLISALNGTGIAINIPEEDICEIVSNQLPVGQDITAHLLFNALVKSTCELSTQIASLSGDIDTIEAELNALNSAYNILCLTGVTDVTDTHDVLQNVINTLCALKLDVETNYVKLSEFNELVEDYLGSQESGSSKYYLKMVPYTIVGYYGSLANFDATGAGLGDWEKIYLCNGLNSTPDMRGRVPVGVMNGVPGGTPSAETNPATPTNPNYFMGQAAGANVVTLDISQIPSHNHTVTDPPHHHLMFRDEVAPAVEINSASDYVASERDIAGNSDYELAVGSGIANVGRTADNTTGISINANGGGQSHSNIQPVRAVHFIMYIP